MAKVKRGGAVGHYVLTVTVGQTRLHEYLMARKGVLERVSAELLDRAERLAGQVGIQLLPIILVTGPLEQAEVQEIRDTLCRADADVARAMHEATDIHRTIFLANPGDWLDTLIMELH